VVSGWQILQKGVSQSSIMGPLLFNIFINDIFYFIEHGTLYNYADDNTLSYADQDYNTLINVLEKESSSDRFITLSLTMKDINICKTNYSHFFQDLDLTLKIQKIKYISHSLLFVCIFF
jgi:hypothetical protein